LALARGLPSSLIARLRIRGADFNDASTLTDLLSEVGYSNVTNLSLKGIRLGELGHIKLVADSLKSMQVIALSLNDNNLSDGDVLKLVLKSKEPQLRRLKLLDQENERDTDIRTAMQTLKPDNGLSISNFILHAAH
jgi:hypothetical protein